jgi:hypothetical protein
MYWGWLPAALATIGALALGYTLRRAFARPDAPAQPGAVLLIAQTIALIPLAAVAALVLGATVVAFFTTIGRFSGPIAPWMFPAGAILLAAIISLLPARFTSIPLARLATLLTITLLIACAVGLSLAFLRGVPYPTFDDTGAQTGIERITPQLVAPMLVRKPDGAPPLFPTIFLVVTSAALAALPWSHTHAPQSDTPSPSRATALEASVAALALVACAVGISMGTTKPVQESGSTGTRPPDHSYVSGAYFWVNDTDGTHGFLSEFRSSDIRVTGWDGYLHPKGIRRIAHHHSSERGEIRGSGRSLPKEVYDTFDIFTVAAMAQFAGIFTNDMERGFLVQTSVVDGQRVRTVPPVVAEFENDAIQQTFHLPSGTVRFDRAGRVVTLTGDFTYQKQYPRFRDADALPSMSEAVIHGGANLLRAFDIPRRVALWIVATIVSVLAFVALEFSLRAQRAAIRAIACLLVPSTTGPACASCGYDMRGAPESTTPTCPECGETERFFTKRDRIALPRRASPFNPARWIAWPPVAFVLTILPLPFIILTPSWGWGQQYTRWQMKVTTADIALWFPMIAAANIALGAGLLLAARRPRSVHAMIVGASTAALTLAALVWLALIVRESPNAYFLRTVGSEYAPSALAGLTALSALVALIGAIHLALTRTRDTHHAATQTDG